MGPARDKVASPAATTTPSLKGLAGLACPALLVCLQTQAAACSLCLQTQAAARSLWTRADLPITRKTVQLSPKLPLLRGLLHLHTLPLLLLSHLCNKGFGLFCDCSLALLLLLADIAGHWALHRVTAQPGGTLSDAGKQTSDLCLPRVSELSGGAQVRQNNVSRASGEKC